MTTGLSKRISLRTTQTIVFTRANVTMATKIAFAAMVTITPMKFAPPTGREIWRKWQFVYTGNTRVPCWIVRVPKEIIWGHGGLWSDNSVAMLAALFRIHFPLTAGGMMAPPQPHLAPRAPDLQQLNQDKLR